MVIIPLLIRDDCCRCFNLKHRLGETMLLQSKVSTQMIDIEKKLSNKEKIKISRLYRNKERQQKVTLSRLMLKNMIQKYNDIEKNIDLKSIEILNQYNEIKGNPFFLINGKRANTDDISISYTTDYVCVGYGKKCKIGVDIEKIFSIKDYKYLLTIFSENEIKEILRDGNRQQDIDYRITLKWCIKEAILKAIGIGFEKGFKCLEFYYSPKYNRNIIECIDGIIDMNKKIFLYCFRNEKLCQVICFIE